MKWYLLFLLVSLALGTTETSDANPADCADKGANTQDKVLVTGATGNIGAVVVRSLIKASVPTTVYVRDEEKTRKMFADEYATGLLTIVVGDYKTPEAFKKAAQGHTRLFLLVLDMMDMVKIKDTFGKIAVDAGIKQIIDISSLLVSLGANNYIGITHRLAEDKLFALDCYTVVLRPGQFYTNTVLFEKEMIKYQSKVIGVSKPSTKMTFISTDDIADISVNILLDPIEKHATNVYDLSSEVFTLEEQAKILTRALGREIAYQQLPSDELYKVMMQHMPYHVAVYALASAHTDWAVDTPQISILLGKPPRKYEDYVKENKAALT